MIESNRLEFKRVLNDSLEKEVVGFLNYHEGGEIYIGIDDNGTIFGVEDSDDMQKRIMRVFKDVKLVEQLGSGVQRILKMYDKNIFKFSSNFLKVNFPMENVGENAFKLNSTQKSIINLVKLDKHMTQSDLSKQLNKSVRTIERNMKTLQEAKIIARIGSNATGYWEVLE